MNWLYTKLNLFTNEDQELLLSLVTTTRFQALSTTDQNEIEYLFSMLNASTTETTKQNLIVYLKEVFLRGITPYVFNVSNGENFNITVDLNVGDDYTGSFLTIRENQTDTLLSDNNVAGTADVSQDIPVQNLNLTVPGLYKVRIQLETDDGGVASGNATALLGTAYFIVELSLDVV